MLLPDSWDSASAGWEVAFGSAVPRHAGKALRIYGGGGGAAEDSRTAEERAEERRAAIERLQSSRSSPATEQRLERARAEKIEAELREVQSPHVDPRTGHEASLRLHYRSRAGDDSGRAAHGSPGRAHRPSPRRDSGRTATTADGGFLERSRDDQLRKEKRREERRAEQEQTEYNGFSPRLPQAAWPFAR